MDMSDLTYILNFKNIQIMIYFPKPFTYSTCRAVGVIGNFPPVFQLHPLLVVLNCSLSYKNNTVNSTCPSRGFLFGPTNPEYLRLGFLAIIQFLCKLTWNITTLIMDMSLHFAKKNKHPMCEGLLH